VGDDVNAQGFATNGGRGIRWVGIIAALLTVVAFGAAGCGGGKDPGTGSNGAQGSPGGNPRNSLEYAQCMRREGIPNFPDPNAEGGVQFDKKGGIDPDSAQFKAADQQCKQYLPAGTGEDAGSDPWTTDLKLRFAKCMRDNGMPNFPDPNEKGQFPEVGEGGKIDVSSAQFKAAFAKCEQYRPQQTAEPQGAGK
jgi:hypothetical protein